MLTTNHFEHSLPNVDDLTPRERDVYPLILQGLSDPEISDILTLHIRWVERLVQHIIEKAGAPSRSKLIAQTKTRTDADASAIMHGLTIPERYDSSLGLPSAQDGMSAHLLMQNYKMGKLSENTFQGHLTLSNGGLGIEEKTEVLITMADTAYALGYYNSAKRLLESVKQDVQCLGHGIQGRYVHTIAKCRYEQAFLYGSDLKKCLGESYELLLLAETLYKRDRTFADGEWLLGIVYFRMALLELWKGEVAAAHKHAKDCLNIGENASDSFVWTLGYMTMGWVQFVQGEYEQSIETAAEGVATVPGTCSAYISKELDYLMTVAELYRIRQNPSLLPRRVDPLDGLRECADVFGGISKVSIPIIEPKLWYWRNWYKVEPPSDN